MPNGTSHSSVRNEYDVSSTRTRVRASANVVGPVGVALRSSAASRCATRASGATSTRAPASRGAPAQVEVLGARERRRVEALQLGEQVDAHEHRGGGDVEHVADAVVLLLVDLAGLDAGVGRAEAVDGAADLEQHLGVVGAHQLGPDDAGVRPVRLLDQHPHRRRVEHDVVVAQQQERRALHHLERLVGRGRRTRHRRRAAGRTRPGSTAATRGVGSSSEPQSTTSTARSG